MAHKGTVSPQNVAILLFQRSNPLPRQALTTPSKAKSPTDGNVDLSHMGEGVAEALISRNP